MGFTDKFASAIADTISMHSADISQDVKNMKEELSALAGLGMVAFVLVSVVAVVALVKASK